MNEYLFRGSQFDTLISIEPSDFLISKYDSELMTTPELKTYIDRQKQRGVANIIGFEIEYHRRFANTAAAFILTLIGMSLSSRKVKGGMGFNIAMGLLLSFSYILFDMVSSTFAISGATSPQIAVWIPPHTIRFYRYRPLLQSPEISTILISSTNSSFCTWIYILPYKRYNKHTWSRVVLFEGKRCKDAKIHIVFWILPRNICPIWMPV